jgi:hypothetical protein
MKAADLVKDSVKKVPLPRVDYERAVRLQEEIQGRLCELRLILARNVPEPPTVIHTRMDFSDWTNPCVLVIDDVGWAVICEEDGEDER